jgi:prephenate dehydrogenase
MRSRSIAILGLGLIGGSLGLSLRRAAGARPGETFTITGWDRDPAVPEVALQRGAIDLVAGDAASAATAADLVVIAVPVLAVREVFEAIVPALRSETVVTDVASTKATVCGWASEMLGPRFVGGHPMAGSERGGIAQARADLFDGAVYCLTPEPHTAPWALDATTRMVEQLRARPRLLDPATHDRILAAISHLPFLLSTALVEVTASDPQWNVLAEIAATGFRDVSRLASADARMHRDICLTNGEAIRPWLQAAVRALEAFAEDLDDADALLRRFDQAKAVRDDMIRTKNKG